MNYKLLNLSFFQSLSCVDSPLHETIIVDIPIVIIEAYGPPPQKKHPFSMATWLEVMIDEKQQVIFVETYTQLKLTSQHPVLCYSE